MRSRYSATAFIYLLISTLPSNGSTTYNIQYNIQFDCCMQWTIWAMHVKSCTVRTRNHLFRAYIKFWHLRIRQPCRTLRFLWDKHNHYTIRVQLRFQDVSRIKISSRASSFTCLPVSFILLSLSFFLRHLPFPLLISFYFVVLIFILLLLFSVPSHFFSPYLSLYSFRFLIIFFLLFLFLYNVQNCAFSIWIGFNVVGIYTNGN